MGLLYNLARMTTATTGTGTITLSSAVSGYLTFALAGVNNGDVISYAINDGANSEIGTGTYTSAGTTLTRTVTKSTETWVREFNEAGVPCGPIYAIDQMFEDAQVKHLGIAQDVPNDEDRRIRLVGQPVTLSRTPSKMVARPPEFGEQTDEVLNEFGFGADEIAGLKGAKVV